MTKLFKPLAVLVMLGCLSSCSSNEEEEMAARRKRVEERKAREAQETPMNQNIDPNDGGYAQVPPLAQEPAAPAEPAVEDVKRYTFSYVGGSTSTISCYQFENSPCGLSFWECSDRMIYECLTNVKYTYVEEKRKVAE